MLPVVWPWHEDDCACRGNGELTVALLEGVATTTAPTAETLRARSVSQKAPEFPQAFTRKVCDPEDVDREVLMDDTALNMVSEPSSTDQAIAEVPCPPQEGACACRLKGFVTVDPFVGVLTATPLPTFNARSFMHKAPWLPQAFTCSV